MPDADQDARHSTIFGWLCVVYCLALSMLFTVVLIAGWGNLEEARSGICSTLDQVFAKGVLTLGQQEIRDAILRSLADRGTQCGSSGTATTTLLFMRLGYEQLIIVQVALAGAIGSLTYAMRSSIWYLGRGEFRASWVPWYLTRPFIGMTLGILVYFVFRAGFITPTARDAINPFGFIAVSALVGLFAEQAMHRFKTVAEAVFQRPDAGPDSTQGTASQPNPSRPQAATTNAPRSLPVPTTQPRFQDGSA